jgi:hypothetical protein
MGSELIHSIISESSKYLSGCTVLKPIPALALG